MKCSDNLPFLHCYMSSSLIIKHCDKPYITVSQAADIQQHSLTLLYTFKVCTPPNPIQATSKQPQRLVQLTMPSNPTLTIFLILHYCLDPSTAQLLLLPLAVFEPQTGYHCNCYIQQDSLPVPSRPPSSAAAAAAASTAFFTFQQTAERDSNNQ